MEPIEENSYALAIREREESPGVQVGSFLQVVFRLVIERTSLLVRAIVGDALTLDEEDALAGILMRCDSLSLGELISLTNAFALINPSDSGSIYKANEALTALLADERMGSLLVPWIEAVGVRARYVKWFRSASESKQLLMRSKIAASEISTLKATSNALNSEKLELSETLRRLKVEIGGVEQKQKLIQSSLDEITVHNV